MSTVSTMRKKHLYNSAKLKDIDILYDYFKQTEFVYVSSNIIKLNNYTIKINYSSKDNFIINVYILKNLSFLKIADQDDLYIENYNLIDSSFGKQFTILEHLIFTEEFLIATIKYLKIIDVSLESGKL